MLVRQRGVWDKFKSRWFRRTEARRQVGVRRAKFEPLEERSLLALIPGLNVAIGTQLTTYTLAMATTAEFTQAAGGKTATSALLSEYVTELNQLYGRELAIQFRLHPQNDLLIFTDAATDGYTNGDNTKMIDENTPIINRILNGSATDDKGYDFGHVLGIGSDGGLAGTGDKGGGASNLFEAKVNLSLVGHEIGHQFSAAHTFNGVLSNCSQRNPGTAYEPGAGSSIMAYAGLCQGDNLTVKPGDSLYFHANSFDEMTSYMTEVAAQRGQRTTTGNSLPTVNAGPDRAIPASTPFRLNATSTDADAADVLTYTWEQIDNGGALTETLLGVPLTVGGKPATLANTLNQLDQTTKPYVPGDRIQITGTDVAGRLVQGSYTFSAGDTLKEFLTGGNLDSTVQSSYYDANRFLTTRVSIAPTGQLLVTARKPGDATLTLTLTSDPGDPQPDSGLTNFGAISLAIDGRADPGGQSLPIPNDRDAKGPLFRSLAPSSDPSRTFPRLADIVANVSQATNKDEHLPTQARELNFRVTARDNHSFQGAVVSGVVSDDVRLTVVDTGAPFRVTSLNDANQVLSGGSTHTITWDVAGTTANGINTSRVDLLLSLDGGKTFPVLLAGQTDNDGSEAIVLPNINASDARLMVRADATQNVFFDINDASFRLQVDTAVPGVLVVESGGDTRVAEGTFSVTGLSGTDTITVALAQAPTAEVQVTIRADSQSTVSLDGTTFAASRVITFPAGDAAPRTVTVRANNDSVAEGAHLSQIQLELTASTDPQYAPARFPAGTLPAVTAKLADDEAPPVVGLDLNFAATDARPTDWTATAEFFANQFRDMTREGGAASPFDLEFTSAPAPGPVATSEKTFESRSIPIHVPNLSGLDGSRGFEQVTSITATWSDLEPGRKYRVYVFAAGATELNQTVAIEGSGVDNPTPFTQQGKGRLDRLIVNDTVGSNTATLESLAKVVTASATGTIAIKLTPGAGVVNLAGLAIQESLESTNAGKVWQNPQDRLDVSGDGVVVPNDVLRIFNELNQPRFRDASGKLPDQRNPGDSFYDVNGDGFVTTNDALQVVNALNNRANPEGEGATAESLVWSEQDWLAWWDYWETQRPASQRRKL